MKFLLSIVLSGLFLNSFSQVKTNFTRQDYSKFFLTESVPADIKKNNHVLIIMSPYKEKQTKENDEIKSIFETYYKGKFVLSPAGTALHNDESYKNTKVYKYMLIISATIERKKHKQYSITMIDNSKVDASDVKSSIADAMLKTGLEDDDSKLADMLIFYAEKLGEAKE